MSYLQLVADGPFDIHYTCGVGSSSQEVSFEWHMWSRRKTANPTTKVNKY